ncbi:MAG: hypothetical protein LIO69_04480 [Oscillospiraceae bacterium]|nr:hypothetical protein [Oscillospiraceae bacterium]
MAAPFSIDIVNLFGGASLIEDRKLRIENGNLLVLLENRKWRIENGSLLVHDIVLKSLQRKSK